MDFKGLHGLDDYQTVYRLFFESLKSFGGCEDG